MATLRTRYMKLDILETELLPSDVVKVKFYRPPNMKVLSGQWIRFSCTGIPPLTRNSTIAVFTNVILFSLFSNWTRRVSFFYTNLGPTRRLFIGTHQVYRSFHLETSKLVSCFIHLQVYSLKPKGFCNFSSMKPNYNIKFYSGCSHFSTENLIAKGVHSLCIMSYETIKIGYKTFIIMILPFCFAGKFFVF